MKKGTIGVVTGVTVGTITGIGIYLYDKLKDSKAVDSMKNGLKLFSRTPIQEINLNSGAEYQDIAQEIKETYKNILEVQITLDDVRDKLAVHQNVVLNQFKETEDNHLVTTMQIEEIKKCVAEIKSILNGEVDTEAENKEEK